MLRAGDENQNEFAVTRMWSPLQCKKEFEQLVTCGQVLSYVRPLKCGMHAPRALMVFVDRIQIAPAVCLTALRVVLVFPTPPL